MKLLELWLPPAGAGRPVACLATSFTFDADFFSSDCLARFLQLTDAYGERDQIADIALLLEEEERLSEARVTVLVDRSCNPEPRNLRWDLIPVSVPGALLHAKVAVLAWEHATRFIIGSANLTAAGYRRQVELATAIDLEAAQIPRSVVVELTTELRLIVRDLVKGDAQEPGPKRRALDILDLIDQRVAGADLPERTRGMKMCIAPARPRAAPLDRLRDVWQGSPPQSLTALAPFWDADDAQSGARALLDQLASRSGRTASTTAVFVVPVERLFGGGDIVRAPAALRRVAPRRIDSTVCAFEGAADDDRRLHAKCVLYESDSWLATMIGSSNMSSKGLGLDPRPHRELNLWIGVRADGAEARRLRRLIEIGPELSTDLPWEPALDEDEDPPPTLPEGFVDAQLIDRARLRLQFDPPRLPNAWRVLTPSAPSVSEALLASDTSWQASSRPSEMIVRLPANVPLPSGLAVRWQAAEGELAATWLVNVGDLAILPPPSELRDLPSTVLLAVLASTRPIREALEQALRRATVTGKRGEVDLDPLKRFDSSGFLLQRIRRAAGAYWGLEQRLARPILSVDALEWRLAGSIGPITLAERLVDEAQRNSQLRGETQFLLAELAMTVAQVPWSELCNKADQRHVRERVAETIATLRALAAQLRNEEDLPQSLEHYVEAAFARCLP